MKCGGAVFLSYSLLHACWVQPPLPSPQRRTPWSKARNCLQIKNMNTTQRQHSNNRHQKWIEIFMAQLFVQCVFYIVLRLFVPCPPKQALGHICRYKKVLLICNSVLYSGKVDSRCGVCMKHEKERGRKWLVQKKRTRFYLHELQQQQQHTNVRSFTQLTMAIPIHVSLLWVVNRLC